MDKPLFSVLLPTHNRAEVVGHAIASVLAQSLSDFELLVVGDGCTDATADVVAGFADPRIRWFDLPKAPGFGYANRNTALREARGTLVANLGHDNLYLPDHLERFAAPFQQPAAQFAYSRPLWLRDDGAIFPAFVNLNLPQARRSFMTERNVLPASTVVYRRALHEPMGGWPEQMEAEGDWALWKRIVAAHPGGVRFVRAPTCLHFRANWRDPAKWAPVPVPYLAAVCDGGPFWPAGLRLPIDPQGGLPQAQVAQMMTARGAEFVTAIRNGTEALGDMLAWNASGDPAFG